MTEKIIQIETKINNILFWLCFFVSLLAIAMTLVEFFTLGAFPPSNINIFYVGILTIYAFHKEALRFLERSTPQRGQRSGEIFVYVWILITAFLYLLNFLTKNYFSFSQTGEELNSLMSITFTTLEVGAVFVLARILKLLMVRFLYKNEGQ